MQTIKTYTNQSYQVIDIVKFIAAIFVIMIHTNPIGAVEGSFLYSLEYSIIRNAVPFFFIASSYFLVLKGLVWERITKYVRRIFILYFYWFILTIPYTITLRIIHSDLPLKESILYFYKSLIWTGSMQGAWFLFACMQSAILLYFLATKCKLKNYQLFSVGIVFYIISVFSSSYWGLSEKYYFIKNIVQFVNITTYHPSFTFFSAFVFFVIGKIIAERKESNKVAIPFMLLFFILEIIELSTLYDYNLPKSNDNFFMLIPFAFFSFQAYLQYNINIKQQICNYMRKSSIIYFLAQFPIIMACKKIMNIDNEFHIFIITILVTTMIAYFIITNSSKHPILKKFY